MTKMEWIRFRNRFSKNPTDENRLAFTRERKFCLSLPRKDNRQYFAKLNEKNITDTRSFWQILNSLCNIFLYDLFLEDENNCYADYAGDTTPYFVGSTIAEV